MATVSTSATLLAGPAPAHAQSNVAPTQSGIGDIAGLSPSGFTLTGVKVSPRGTWARINYKTNAPEVKIRISTYKPVKKNGVWVDPIMDSIIGPESAAGGTTTRYNAMSLTPASTYYVTVTVPTGKNQIPVQAVTSFTTKSRTVTIVWDRIVVTDDSDPGAKGAGDFTFWIRSNGKQIAHFSRDIKSDSTYVIDLEGNGSKLTQVVPNVVKKDIPIDIQLFENDVQSWDHCGGQLLGDKAWDGKGVNKENACGTWASMHTQYSAAPGIYGAGEGFREGDTVEMRLSPWKSSVHLTVIGTMTATWS